MTIEFTRYNLPNGRKTTEMITIDPETDALGNKLIESGITFSIEILTTGMVALYATNSSLPEPEDDFDTQEICYISQNGPEIIGKVKGMINEAAERWEEGKEDAKYQKYLQHEIEYQKYLLGEVPDPRD